MRTAAVIRRYGAARPRLFPFPSTVSRFIAEYLKNPLCRCNHRCYAISTGPPSASRTGVAAFAAQQEGTNNNRSTALLVALGLGAAVATDACFGPAWAEAEEGSPAGSGGWVKSGPGKVPRLAVAEADADDADEADEGEAAAAEDAAANNAGEAEGEGEAGGEGREAGGEGEAGSGDGGVAPAAMHAVAAGPTPHGYDVAPGSRYHSAAHEAAGYENWRHGCAEKPFPRQRAFRCPARERSDMAGGTYPILSLEEVRADHGEEVWVCLDGGVYNVTPFLDAHPGGATRIMMAAGGDLSKFWAVYRLHNRPHVRKLLEEYRIGTLSAADAARVEAETEFASYYDGDPARPKAADGTLRVPSEHPWNSEPPVGALVEHFYTPNDLFFVRNHNSVPLVDAATWELEVEGNEALGIGDRTFTLEELKTKFPRTEVSAALQCAGNRQEDYVTEDRPLYVAPHWRNAAIGNAKWAGVLVRDVLRECGMDVDAIALRRATTNGMKIVNFIAEDTDETGVPYAGVIPIEKVVDPYGDALLAYEMNGETLPRDHGYPVRLLAPGHAGCRNVKWVRQIVVSAEASELDSGSRLDRHFAPDISWGDHRDHVDPGFAGHNRVRTDQGPVIQTLPVQSVIAVPAHRATVAVRPGREGHVLVKGVAWSGGGRGITRVEVSADGGKHFTAAELSQAPPEQADAPKAEQGMGRNWCWHHFAQEVPLSPDVQAKLAAGEKVEIEVVSKAVDGDFNSQPERMSHTWNVLGICVNHWARSRVTLDPAAACDACAAEPAPGSCKWHADGFK